MFKNLFGLNCSSPNVICLIGHPEGKLLWALCDSTRQFYCAQRPQVLFDMKQPVAGVFFLKDIEAFKGLLFETKNSNKSLCYKTVFND